MFKHMYQTAPNIFWMDNKIIVDYDLFGDVVYFDSMY